MKHLIEAFAAQVIEGQRIGQNISLTKSTVELKNILLLGMGGSAFGGELTKNLIADSCSIPFAIGRAYDIPAWVNEHTLIIASSYSGNTEETISALKLSVAKKAKIVCITSGGDMKTYAQNHHLDCIEIPTGYPPRSAVGFSFIPQLYVLQYFGLFSGFESDISEAIQIIQNFSDNSFAESLAQSLKGNLGVFYSSPDFESIAIRVRQQINENSKQLVLYHCVPEMNHNELVGWEYPEKLIKDSVVVMFRSNLDHLRINLRFELNKKLLESKGVNVVEIWAKGSSRLAQLMYLLHFSDWLSVYLAEQNGVDPTPVQVIDHLKSALAKA